MFAKMLAILAALVILLIPSLAPPQAAPLLPMQLGGLYIYDSLDCIGHTWQSSIWVVAQNISLNSNTYYQIRRQNWDPYATNPLGSEDLLIRSDEVAAYASLGGPEWRQFQTTGSPQTWTYFYPPGQTLSYIAAQVNGLMSVTVPYGGPFQAYENQFTFNNGSGVQSSPWYNYLVPGLGMIKEMSTDVHPSRIQRTNALSQVGAMGVSLFPMITGNTWTYNASDKLGHTWQMRMQTLGQVSFGGHTYFRMRQTNYDPIGGDVYHEFYLRCSTNQAWVSYDGVTEHLAFQAAGPGTNWDYPDPWEPGTDYITIASIGSVNVLGGSFLAYRHDGQFVGPGGLGGSWIDYVVPALGIARMEDSDIEDQDRKPLIFELVNMEQRGLANPGLMLLLE